MLNLRHRFLDALFYAIDGNFHATLKDKRSDPDDFPLSKGSAYFADEDAFKAFAAKLPPLGPDVRQPYLIDSWRGIDVRNSPVRATSSRLWDTGRIGERCRGQ